MSRLAAANDASTGIDVAWAADAFLSSRCDESNSMLRVRQSAIYVGFSPGGA